MIPKGLAAAVLASVPTQKGLEGGAEIQAVTFAGVFISILLTALMIPALKVRKVQTFYDAFLGGFAADGPDSPTADAKSGTVLDGGVKQPIEPDDMDAAPIAQTAATDTLESTTESVD